MPTLRFGESLGAGCRVWRRCEVRSGLLLLLWIAAFPAWAQYGAHVTYNRVSYANGLGAAKGMAVDASGNVYFASGGYVYQTPYNDYYATTALPLPSGETAGSYVAVDASGNVFFDATNGSQPYVVKATYSGGSYTAANFGPGLPAGNTVGGLAVDAAGAVFVSSGTGSSYIVKKYSAGGVDAGVSLATGASTALAVDASDTLYFLLPNSGNPLIERSVLNSGTYPVPTAVLLGFCASCTLTGLTVDAANTMYVADNTDGVVLRFPIQAGGSYSATSVARLATALSGTTGFALDSKGVLYTEDSYGGGYIDTLTPPTAANLGTVALGSSGGSTTVQFRFDAAVTLGSIVVSTRGAPSLDFTNTGAGTCTAGQNYTQGASCTVGVGFAASKFAGARAGAVTLLDNSGAVLGTGYVYGTATGSQLAYANPISSTIPSALAPLGVAVDGNGAVYFVSGTDVLRDTPRGSTYTVSTVASGLTGAQYVAVDGAGAVYFVSTDPTDTSLQAVLKASPNGIGGYATPVPVLRKLTSPAGLAVDGAGDVFVADFLRAGPVYEVQEAVYLAGAYVQTQLANLNNLQTTSGLAIDLSGNLYLAYPSGQIQQSTLSGGVYSSPVTLATGLGRPEGMAVDAAGDVYVADFSNNRVVRLMAGSRAQTTLAVSGSVVLTQPFGVAVDDAGNLYVSSYGNDGMAVAPASAPALTFATTAVGATSSDSPKTVTIEDIGTSALTLASDPLLGLPDPSVSTSFNVGSGSTCPQLAAGTTVSLAAGAMCSYQVNFAPTGSAGNTTGTLTVSYRNQSLAYTTSTVNLSGVTVYPVAATPVFSPAGGTYTATQPVRITDTSTGFGAIYYTVDGTTPTTGSTQYTGPVTVAVSETLKAIYAGSGYSQSAVASAVYTIDQPPVCSVTARGTSAAGAVTATASCTDPQASAITAYSFTWGDGSAATTGTSGSAMHTYAAAGTYTVTLKATDALGLTSAAATTTVKPNEPPVCSVSAKPGSAAGAATAAATCTDPQASAIATYIFNWGDGSSPTTGTGSSAAHTYAAAGSYTVTLTATDTLGLASTGATATVTPNEPPVCALAAGGTSTAGVVSATATCTDPQASAIVTYSFDWGDGSSPATGTSSSATHTYAAAGTYTVTLTAIDALGLTSAMVMQAVKPNQVPVCSLVARATSTVGGVTASATCTDPQASAIGRYTFSWGDGSLTPAAVNASSHTYSAAGSYTVAVTVTDALGLSSAAVMQNVTPNQAPVCSLTVGGTSTAGTVTAQAACTDPQNSAVTTYSFNWGDGSAPATGALTGATHSYPVAGTYTVTLTATDSLGVSGNASQRVTPNQLPACSIVVHGTATAGAVAATATCTDPQNSALASYSFNWGDGQSASGSNNNAAHTYTAPGSYTVTLAATDALGLTGGATANVTPNQLPVCVLSVIQGTSTQVVNGVSMTFVTATPTCSDPQNQLLQPVIQWGDGAVDTVPNGVAANHGYVTPAVATTVPVLVTETDGSGLTGTATQAVALLALVAPPAGMSANASGQAQQQPSGVAPTQVTFLCTGLQVGNSTVTVLPSLYGITCTAPTFTATSTSASDVTVSVQTTAAAANAAWLSPYGSHGSAVLAAALSLPGVLLLGLGAVLPGRRRLRDHLRAGGVLLLLCCTLCSCGGGSFTPPPVIPTPKGLYLLTITEVVTGGATPTSFVQTSLIVPLEVK